MIFLWLEKWFPLLMLLKQKMCTCENERCENKDVDDQWEILTASRAAQLLYLFQTTLDVD